MHETNPSPLRQSIDAEMLPAALTPLETFEEKPESIPKPVEMETEHETDDETSTDNKETNQTAEIRFLTEKV